MFTQISGRLAIRTTGGRDEPAPYEWFTITGNPDGSRSLRVVTKSPDASLVRDTTQTFDGTWAPIEGGVRIIRDGKLLGSLVRRIEGETVRSYLFDPHGRPSVDERDFMDGLTFGFHSVASNPWKFGQHDGSPGPQPCPILTHSLTWNGGTMGFGDVSHTTLELVGVETVTVPAGTFECDHFRWTTEVDGEIHVWSTRDDEKVYVRGHQLDRDIVYELQSLDRWTQSS